jgi:hypothetical protein
MGGCAGWLEHGGAWRGVVGRGCGNSTYLEKNIFPPGGENLSFPKAVWENWERFLGWVCWAGVIRRVRRSDKEGLACRGQAWRCVERRGGAGRRGAGRERERGVA